ncbi:phosphotransferase [Paludibacteraceae bacterium OttesenSCG-928-F17]|nr:phosphotransferase [Paludibacteraceae bacterium OttesenSCG-928-F17]
MKELEILFQEFTSDKLLSIKLLSGSGSNRKYYRLQSESHSVIGVEGTSIDENRAFIYMATHFHSLGLPAPQVLVKSKDDKFYLQEDLGDTLLFDYIVEGRRSGNFSEKEKQMLIKTIEKLPEVQINGAKDFDFSYSYPLPEFNERSIMWDLNYFKYCYLKPTGIDFQENLLEDDFLRLSSVLLKSQQDAFMYRDFQSRNVIVKNEQPYFIDFQGGRKGPVQYDVASFLWQAKANFSPKLREELIEVYLKSLKKLTPVDEKEFHSQLKHFVLFRILQVLGAYGYRGHFEKKTHFLESIPPALENLKEILKGDITEYPYLTGILKQMTEKKEEEKPTADEGLTVTIYSFSYKKGIPEDTSGNGGGFVFDCRSIHNPGRYEEYKSLTGLDKPVIDFLEKDGEITVFLQHIHAITDSAIERYIERKFNNLMINFGCTGGQHRSVYAAQRTAEHLHQKYGIKVHLIHREQNIEKIFTPNK